MSETAYLPIARKKDIQEAYLWFKDLRTVVRSIERQIVAADVAKWGGLVAYIFSFFPKGTFAGYAGIAGLVGLIGWYWGWECRKDRKSHAFREELIVGPLKSVGVHIEDQNGVIRVFVKTDAGHSEVWPFDDANYR